MYYFSRLLSIFLIAFVVPTIYASEGYDARFTVDFQDNILYLNIKLDNGYKIYSNEPGEVGFPTNIDLSGSENLASSHILWPVPEKEYFHGTMYHYIYFGDVSIPIEITSIDATQPVVIKGRITYAICENKCVPVTQDIEYNIGIISSHEGIWWILLAAFVGGVILNFMPCVLPVLCLKVFAILNNRGKNYRSHLICAIFGIMSTFLLLGYVVFWMKSIGMTFGLGANFQDPRFVIILCIVMVIFTSNLLGRFEITVPDSIASKLSGVKFSSAYIGSFMSGVIATIFATPCTAPFLGTAISFAMTAEFMQIITIFWFISLGFSLPYFMFLASPSLLKMLPKPGPWMAHFKRILALAMIGTILWLLSILQAQLGMRATIGALMLLFLMKFTFEQEHIAKPLRFILAALLFLCAIYLPMMARDEDQAKINEELKLWEPFDEVRLRQYINHGQIVLVDITADWCMTCKYNKFMLWNRSKTIKFFKDNNIITMRGDLTKPSLLIHEYLRFNGVYGIPFDIIYGPNMKKGLPLPTLVQYEDLVNAVRVIGKN